MQATLDRYAAGAVARLGPGTFCSLTISAGETVSQVASNDDRAAACDRVEIRERAGPCLTAMGQLYSVVIDDLQADDRWPRWNQAAQASGFRSFVALPGYVDEDTTVAVNAYSEGTHTWTAHGLVAMDLYVQELAGELRQ
jgi:hypothetical protein